MDPLKTSLIDLLYELRDDDLRLIIGGGFGLFLKRQHLAAHGARMLFDRLPSPRATNDIDLFLRAEVLADPSRAKELAEAIQRLGYTPIPGAELYQWKRGIADGDELREVKLDLLVGPLGPHRPRLQVDARRARPRGERIGLHAHPTEEALGIEETPIAVALEGPRSGGDVFGGTVYVPRAFPYLLMKLHAFRDRKDDADKDMGRHHALDLYAIVGMQTEDEYMESMALGRSRASEPQVRAARQIVPERFADRGSVGLLRLREHPLTRPDFTLDDFTAVLAEIFPP